MLNLLIANQPWVVQPWVGVVSVGFGYVAGLCLKQGSNLNTNGQKRAQGEQ